MRGWAHAGMGHRFEKWVARAPWKVFKVDFKISRMKMVKLTPEDIAVLFPGAGMAEVRRGISRRVFSDSSSVKIISNSK